MGRSVHLSPESMPLLIRKYSDEGYASNEEAHHIGAKDHLDSLRLKSPSQSQPFVVVKTEATLTKAAKAAPPSKWPILCHSRMEQIIQNGEGYVVDNWKCPSEKVKQALIAGQFGRAAAVVFPYAEDDRIDMMCRLCTTLVIVDDIMDNHLTQDQGKFYSARLMSIMGGIKEPKPDESLERILFEAFTAFRAQDSVLAAQLLEGIRIWFAAMAEASRNNLTTLGVYLDYREQDVGMSMMSAMVRYAMAIELTSAELELIRPVEKNFIRQYCCVNDVCSWEKEWELFLKKGLKPLSGVSLLMEETGLPVDAAKSVLWSMIRAYSDAHDELEKKIIEKGCSEAVRRYLLGIRNLMSGNEEWHVTCPRYNADVKI